MDLLDDDTLLRQWQDGDGLAFERLYKRHLRLLINIALNKTGNFETSREIVQETFIVFYKKKDSILDNPLLYLQKILKFKILEFYRKERKNKEVSTELSSMPLQSENDLWEKVLHNDTNTTLLKAIVALPSQQRQIFQLSRFEHLSNKEIASQLNISVKTVEANITKALKFIKSYQHLILLFFF